MKTIGVTGGIGSGKSTVCRLLAGLGARVFDADAVGRDLLARDQGVRDAVMRTFGPYAYPDGGPPDRKWLAEQVFASDGARKVLEGIVHPAVAREFNAAREEALADGCPVLLKEQAVFPTDAVRTGMDAWVVVDAPLPTRLDRVMTRSGLTRDQARARVQAQPDAAAYRAIADHVIVNDGGLDELEGAVQALWNEWGQTEGGQPGTGHS